MNLVWMAARPGERRLFLRVGRARPSGHDLLGRNRKMNPLEPNGWEIAALVIFLLLLALVVGAIVIALRQWLANRTVPHPGEEGPLLVRDQSEDQD